MIKTSKKWRLLYSCFWLELLMPEEEDQYTISHDKSHLWNYGLFFTQEKWCTKSDQRTLSMKYFRLGSLRRDFFNTRIFLHAYWSYRVKISAVFWDWLNGLHVKNDDMRGIITQFPLNWCQQTFTYLNQVSGQLFWSPKNELRKTICRKFQRAAARQPLNNDLWCILENLLN